MQHDLDCILIDRRAIAARIEELAEAIRQDLDELGADGEIVLVPILTGSIIFLADLIRHLPQKIRIGVVAASSYRGRSTKSSGHPTLSEMPADLANKHVVIVDDILDSGTTIRRMREEIARCNPRTIRTCVLLRKEIPSALDTPCEYVGFDIPDAFVVGYGLDYDGYYRNLPDIGVLKQEALEEAKA